MRRVPPRSNTPGWLDHENVVHYHVAVDGSAFLAEAKRLGRVMTRCECADLPFDEIARRVREEGLSLEALQRETECGQLCTACLPDLHEHLSARG
jgi:NAD(P)H-nitrite reductase large subunit